jgi:hypothetical protein
VSRTLVFSIAMNGFAARFDRCLRSQRRYARRHGYDYAVVTRPRHAPPEETAWLKIPLLLRALDRGYEWVVFLDADCEARDAAPRIESVAGPGKSVYMALGFSGRPNAGVLIGRRDDGTRTFLQSVVRTADQPVPPEDEAPYENGHVIHLAKGKPFVAVLDRRWNNNADPCLDDYIRHYSQGGPMRPLYRPTLRGRLADIEQRLRGPSLERSWALRRRASLGERIARLERRVAASSPTFDVERRP